MATTSKETNPSASKNLSSSAACTSCVLSIGLVLPYSDYASNEAVTVGELAQKVAVATSAKMSADEKETIFKKMDELLVRHDHVSISPEVMESTWKSVLQYCPHLAERFKEMLGKSLEGYEVDDKDIVHRMIAVQNGIHFMAVMKNMDTVVVGHKNAERLKNAIGANYYPIHQPDDSETRGRVVFSSKAKRIIYVPTEALLYGPQSQFDAATKIIISTFENLKKSNNCDTVIMLPIFRHVKFSEKSQAFVKWYKEMATKNQDYIGMKEIDEMKLIHWLNATPNNAATEYVDEYGILTEAGTRRLAEYLNSVGFACTHRVLQMENVSEPLSNPIQSKEITNRGGYRNRGTSLTRGKYTTFSRNTRRGFKRNAHEEQSEYAPSNRQRRDQRNK